MKRRLFLKTLIALVTLAKTPLGRGREMKSTASTEVDLPVLPGIGRTLPAFLDGCADLSTDYRSAKITVIGIGGAGSYVVEHLIRSGVKGVEFARIGTVALSACNSDRTNKLLLGPGFGTGSRPEAGRRLAEVGREQITRMLRGNHLVFLVAGMGGGTGSGATPLVAQVARELGILSVAVVTKPFGFEGERVSVGEQSITELAQHVDSMIVLSNEEVAQFLGENATLAETFQHVSDAQKIIVGGISEIINVPGLVNVDFEDLRTVLGDMGQAKVGSSRAVGADRARLAATGAVSSLTLGGTELSDAHDVLAIIGASPSLQMKDVKAAMNAIRNYASADATIIFGTTNDESLEDSLRVTVVATDFIPRRPQVCRCRDCERSGRRACLHLVEPI